MWDNLLLDFLQSPGVMKSIVSFSIFTFLLSLLFIPLLIVRLPADYFSAEKRAVTAFKKNKPWLCFLINAGRNTLGGLIFFIGVLMLVLPGQGLVTMLLGLGLMNFPGKFGMEKKLVRLPGVLAALNWIRTRANRPPLRCPLS